MIENFEVEQQQEEYVRGKFMRFQKNKSKEIYKVNIILWIL